MHAMQALSQLSYNPTEDSDIIQGINPLSSVFRIF